MPVHPSQASRFALLDGLTSFEAAMADPASRARLDAFMSLGEAPPAPDVHVRDTVAPGPHGDVPVRVYSPAADGTGRPGFVWMHGGAFRAGDLDMPEADRTAREVCARAGAVVVSVDYRLAVDGVTYPVPHDDVVAAVRWVRDEAAALGVDPARITVGGASAGGNLATGATLRLRDDEGWQPAALVLAYTTTHAVLPPASAELTALMAEVPVLLRFPPAAGPGSPATTSAGPRAGPTGTRCRPAPS
ncbi:alpha/beta hydrolase [Klenkia terrae]|uniref:alpha/beta hydrolase n=1 Tax=Klenkia terrae TaxID=1052259 RepID=UPI00361BC838